MPVARKVSERKRSGTYSNSILSLQYTFIDEQEKQDCYVQLAFYSNTSAWNVLALK